MSRIERLVVATGNMHKTEEIAEMLGDLVDEVVDLRAHPEVAAAYGDLKRRLAADHPGDRVAYTEGKTAFVVEVTARAKATRLQG